MNRLDILDEIEQRFNHQLGFPIDEKMMNDGYWNKVFVPLDSLRDVEVLEKQFGHLRQNILTLSINDIKEQIWLIEKSINRFKETINDVKKR